MTIAKIYDFEDPVYKYKVQIFKNGIYAGVGRFCKDLLEVKLYCISQKVDKFYTFCNPNRA